MLFMLQLVPSRLQLPDTPWPSMPVPCADLRPQKEDYSVATSTISLFEHWEGAHLPVALNARDYAFPSSLVIPFTWIHSPESLSLLDAINNVSLHGEKKAWGQASQINLVPGVNYPNQPRSNPDSHLSDPLTYWWGVTYARQSSTMWHWQRPW